MAKSNVYTGTGDKGDTSLVSGNRVPKSSYRINLYGEVDELNSFIGLLSSHLAKSNKFSHAIELISKVQHSLFDLGSNLACEKGYREKFKLPVIEESLITEIELAMDELDSKLPKLKTFVLPGGHEAASTAHVCRTVCRRVERQLVQFHNEYAEDPEHSIRLLNRLSDYFFILSRYINFEEKYEEVLWIPKKS
jgi:cob(I)alamin adenosyltransferase